MTHRKGTITAITQHGGCVEITVAGPRPGSFPVGNSCFAMLVANEGPDLIGRPIEYEDGYLQFLDIDEEGQAA